MSNDLVQALISLCVLGGACLFSIALYFIYKTVKAFIVDGEELSYKKKYEELIKEQKQAKDLERERYYRDLIIKSIKDANKGGK